MTGSEHSELGELAAGYALNALEPADEQRFLRHAAGCPDCQRVMAEFGEVAAALAETAPPAEPSEDLGLRIMAATRPGRGGIAADAPAEDAPATGAPADLPPGVVRLRPRSGGWRPRWMAAAAAAVLIAAGGVWGGLAATSANTPAPLAMCARPHACSEVTLIAGKTHQVAGKVVVAAHKVWMLPTGMTANPANHIYVLWQVTGTHHPLPVGSFNVRTGAHAPIAIGGLAAPYSGTWAFAVSLEAGSTIPATPSNEVALGQVS
jgi:anti-sigma-K factor RskA